MAAALMLSGCSIGHYAHLLRGHYDLMSRRVPITELLAAPDTPEPLRQQLTAALDARTFASRVLHLPDNDSYMQYADLGRPFVQWTVLAAPELSLDPRQWCFFPVGCFAYVGYYDEARARDQAGSLAAEGFDTHVSGVAAYSTLGWFDDPVLNTMLRGSADRLAGLILHELAHQRLHVRNDTAFNESFASFVEEQGLGEFLRAEPGRLAAWQAQRDRERQFTALVLEARDRLAVVYAGAGDAAGKRQRKREEFQRLHARVVELRTSWGAEGDGGFSAEPNNARLLPFALYGEWVPAFAALFRRAGGDWPRFYTICEEIGALESTARQAALREALAGIPPST